MKKYMVLFTPEAVDPADDSFKGMKIQNMMFAYTDPKDAWTFDTAAECHKEAKANDYRPGIDYIVVRVLK